VNTSSTDATRAATPRLSVIVVSFNRQALLRQCLDALVSQATPAVDIVVVRDRTASDNSRIDALRASFPTVRWIDADAGCTVPRMRALGIDSTQSDIVGLLEDDCVVEQGWCQAALAAHATSDVAIGGAVEPGPYTRALDWAVYFCEYARFMLPLPNPPVALAGNNVTYKRAALNRASIRSRDGFFDVFVHWTWQQERQPMRNEHTIVVRNVNSWSRSHVTSVPYHHGRAFAGRRFERRSASRRIAFALLVPFLPAVKVARVAGEVIRRRRLLGPLIRAFPWLVLFMISWSVGEGVGTLAGPGGSGSRWR
jgi:glycosyltransferase involved in cell wall biosynthesis